MTTRIRAGLVILGLLSVGDIVALAATDGDHPPYAIAVLGALLGIASLYFLIRAWRGHRTAVRPLLGLRILSAVTAVPAFFVDDVPTAAVTAAAVVIVLTAVGCALVASPAPAPAVTR